MSSTPSTPHSRTSTTSPPAYQSTEQYYGTTTSQPTSAKKPLVQVFTSRKSSESDRSTQKEQPRMDKYEERRIRAEAKFNYFAMR